MESCPTLVTAESRFCQFKLAAGAKQAREPALVPAGPPLWTAGPIKSTLLLMDRSRREFLNILDVGTDRTGLAADGTSASVAVN